ncbi:XkdX family protein [Desulfitobacterium hafniense]|nr:XkdX family protein [Desulfitobacterium hafniense]
MTNFERIKYYFDKGWATVTQLRMYVQYGVISPEEFDTIAGEPYETE